MEMKHRQKHISLRCSNQGFTMVELLVAMVVSLLALAAIYSTFLAQHRSYQVQEETADDAAEYQGCHVLHATGNPDGRE